MTESVEGSHPHLNAMKEAIEPLTNAVQRMEQRQTITSPLAEAEVEFPTKEIIG